MSKSEQGVLQQSKSKHSLIRFLLPVALCLSHAVYAESIAEETLLKHEKNIQKHHLVFIYSPDSTLQSNIAQTLSETLINKDTNIVVTTAIAEDKKSTANKKPDLIIAIGFTGIQSANKYYPETNKLFISTDPGKYRPDISSDRKNAVLYMSQPYCRQIQFIKLINQRWKTIGFLNSQVKPVETRLLQQCANKYNIKTYEVNTTGVKNLTNEIKDALNHSDILLALPDKNIYNSKTVKNILLTSYRYRKPVIAFSRNFVNAGALASIYSTTEQISKSASSLIEQYISNDYRFEKIINHPQSFDISINRQVFKALNINVPDIGKLKQTIENSDLDNPGYSP